MHVLLACTLNLTDSLTRKDLRYKKKSSFYEIHKIFLSNLKKNIFHLLTHSGYYHGSNFNEPYQSRRFRWAIFNEFEYVEFESNKKPMHSLELHKNFNDQKLWSKY